MNKKIEVNVRKMIEEITFCKEHEQYFAALSTALMLPYRCVDFEMGDMMPEWYIEWCNEWLGKELASHEVNLDLYNVCEKADSPARKCTWGDVAYKMFAHIVQNACDEPATPSVDAIDIDRIHLYIANDDDNIKLPPMCFGINPYAKCVKDAPMFLVEVREFIDNMLNAAKHFLVSNDYIEEDKPYFTIHLGTDNE